MGWFIGASGRARSVASRSFPLSEAVVVEAAQILLSLGVVFVGANLVKSIGETFHGRHTYTQAFTAVAYSLGPLFLLRLLDAFTGVSPWVTWAIGIMPVRCRAVSWGAANNGAGSRRMPLGST